MECDIEWTSVGGKLRCLRKVGENEGQDVGGG